MITRADGQKIVLSTHRNNLKQLTEFLIDNDYPYEFKPYPDQASRLWGEKMQSLI